MPVLGICAGMILLSKTVHEMVRKCMACVPRLREGVSKGIKECSQRQAMKQDPQIITDFNSALNIASAKTSVSNN